MIQAREIMWRRVLDDMSFERARIEEGRHGPLLSGLVLVAEKGAPLEVRYSVQCDVRWETRAVELSRTYLGERKDVRLDHDGAGHWQCDGREAPDLAGCTDIDIGITPSTNALAINRLRLPQGKTASIRAAWAQFPELEVAPAGQSYERLAPRRYRYRSLSSNFEAVVDVDNDGIPIDYSSIWRRVAEGPIAAPRMPAAATGKTKVKR